MREKIASIIYKSLSGDILGIVLGSMVVTDNLAVLPGAGENTLRRLAHFLCLDHPTKSDVTSGKKEPRAGKIFLDAAFAFSR